MGLVRKTLSIGTLGIIPFRSKREKLRRAEREAGIAREELAREQSARVDAEVRIGEAEKRLHRAELEAMHAAKRAAKARRRSKRGPGAVARGRKVVGEVVGEVVGTAKPVAHDMSRRARKAAERAEKSTRKTRKDAKKRMKKAKDDVVDLTTTKAADLRERAEELASRR